jgi:hypothetical protein
MHIGNKTMQSDRKYQMDGNPLKVSTSEKDLGLTIDSGLTFDEHISSKVSKANSLVGLIRRSFEYMNIATFKQLFTAIVRPHLEYANAIWNPHQMKQINAVENVQRRATKMVPGLSDLSYEQRLRSLQLPTLAYRRYRGDMIEMFKLTHGIYDQQVSQDFLCLQPSRARGHPYNVYKQGCRLNVRKYSFRFRVTDQWNNLPEHVVTADSLNQFKSRLDKLWKGTAVYYDHNTNVHMVTSSRSNRCAHHAQTKTNEDLMSEA